MCNCKKNKRASLSELKKDYDNLQKKTKELEEKIKFISNSLKNNSQPLVFKD